MLQPADIWALWGAAITAYLVGVIAWMQPSVRLCERGSAWWLLAPVFWPLATLLLVRLALAARRQAAAYARLRAAQAPVRLVREGTPYGSPVSGALAGQLGVQPGTGTVPRPAAGDSPPSSSDSRCPAAAGPAP